VWALCALLFSQRSHLHVQHMRVSAMRAPGARTLQSEPCVYAFVEDGDDEGREARMGMYYAHGGEGEVLLEEL
jgi:hypothetical protein